MIFGICNFSIMTAAGRRAFWHFKSSLLLAAQAAVAVSLVLVIFGKSLPVFVIAFIVMGCGFGFIYCSHLYYGTTGKKKRSRQMVIHEATLSLGIVIGSGTGGFIARSFSLYSPYWFNLALLAAGFIAQIFLLPRGKINGDVKSDKVDL
jgi:predicted MFS family arabinose efflux permease